MQNTNIQGIPGAPGMARGPAFVWQKKQVSIPRLSGQDPAKETERLQAAVEIAKSQIQAFSQQLEAENHPEEAAVFMAHAMLVEDKALHRRVKQLLTTGLNVEAAWTDAIEAFALQLEQLQDETFRLRAADLRDIGERVVRILLNESAPSTKIDRPSIIFAQDLTPSETVSMDKKSVLAFCTAGGGPTSHTAILAKALGIPAVVSLGTDILEVNPGSVVLVNGMTGLVVISPDEQTETTFNEQLVQASTRSKAELSAAMNPAVTLDGKRFEVVANIGGVDDARNALNFGAEGVGLFRTEFLFLGRTCSPDEEEQYQAYKAAMDVLGDRPIVVRTLDAGGDKELCYLSQGQEANPFLGWRAIRICLSQPELFRKQLRALLRAGHGHDLRIMFPMIATLQEIRQAKALLTETLGELKEQGVPVVDKLQVGIMIEIPSAAILAIQLAREVDFFSIGTNDLTQYTLAADRTNPKLAHLNDPCHPAVLYLIKQTAEAAHAAGIWIGVCGEMAGDVEALPVLIGLGIDELSMSPALIPRSKSLIRKLSTQDAEVLAQRVLECDSAEAVRDLIRKSI